MDKFELKSKLEGAYDSLSEIVGDISAERCSDEVGKTRSKAIKALCNAAETLKEIAYGIY